MIEEIEAALAAHPLEGAELLLIGLAIGLTLDLFVLPRLQRWAGHQGKRLLGVTVHALRGLPTVFSLMVGGLALISNLGLPLEMASQLLAPRPAVASTCP